MSDLDTPDPEPTPAFLEARGVVWKNDPDSEEVDFHLPRGPVYLHGTRGLVDALVTPEQHLCRGQFLVHGSSPKSLLRTGELGICPTDLPVPKTTRLVDALMASAYLVSRSRSEIQRCLEQVGLLEQQGKSLGQLTPEERRRAGIAHGLLTQPHTLIFVAPFSRIGDRARRDLSRLIERITQDRNWILGGEPSCSVSSTWMKRAAWIVSSEEGKIRSSSDPKPAGDCYFLRLTRTPAGLAAELKNQGASVTPSENPRVLVVTHLEGAKILEICEQFSDCTVVSLQLAEERGFRSVHAKSAL